MNTAKLERFKPFLLILLILLLFPSMVHADKGMIPLSDVSPYEPGQKAILACNGEEEVLILSTDVSASKHSLILEVLPLPSNPEIKEGTIKSFERMEKLIGERMKDVYELRGLKEGAPGVEIIFHKRIGAHDLTVVKVRSYQEFLKWIADFLKDKKIKHEVDSPRLRELISIYLEQGLNFFVFDLITVDPEPRSVKPLIYKFKSDSLYYPLEISSLASGNTRLSLFIITKDKLDSSSLEKVRLYPGLTPPFRVGEDELRKISPDVSRLFNGYAWLTPAHYIGPIQFLSGDLQIPIKSRIEDRGIERLMPIVLAIFGAMFSCILACLLILLRLQRKISGLEERLRKGK
ncbi:MAG: DUF2330 domain-containing protein [Actinomycetota bacterium]|nr:DUF2330 domain-containing protein [Actinomycetota bacterium]